jgi:hypothetical protein
VPDISSDPPGNVYLTGAVTEDIDFESLFFFRLPTTDAQAALPPELRALEIGPGSAILALGIQKLLRTTFSECLDIQKLYLGIAVRPRYDLGTATPRFAFFLPRMYTNKPVFSQQVSGVNRVPVHSGSGLEVRYDYDNFSVSARDQDGPLFKLGVTIPKPAFRKVDAWGQSHTVQNGVRFTQTTHWSGEAFESSGNPSVGELYEHPFFGGLHVSPLGQQCYHQMIMKPGVLGTMTLYRPVAQESAHV